MKNFIKTFGYYRITITQQGNGRLMQSNNERAYFISQLQDLLSPRLLLNEVPAHKQLASCIDLLAFSVRGSGIDLILFTIDIHIAANFIECLINRLSQYQAEYSLAINPDISSTPDIRFQKLAGPHQALSESTTLHLLHQDWEFDRYSSIGFYLHDRRGDWMRTWRVAQLYDNQPAQYLSFITPIANSVAGDPSTASLQLAS